MSRNNRNSQQFQNRQNQQHEPEKAKVNPIVRTVAYTCHGWIAVAFGALFLGELIDIDAINNDLAVFLKTLTGVAIAGEYVMWLLTDRTRV